MPETKPVALCPHPVLCHACVDSAVAATPNTSEQQNKTGSGLQVGLALSGLTLSFVPHLTCPGFQKALQLETLLGRLSSSVSWPCLSLLSLSSSSLMHPLLSSPTNENPHLSEPGCVPPGPAVRVLTPHPAQPLPCSRRCAELQLREILAPGFTGLEIQVQGIRNGGLGSRQSPLHPGGTWAVTSCEPGQYIFLC